MLRRILTTALILLIAIADATMLPHFDWPIRFLLLVVSTLGSVILGMYYMRDTIIENIDKIGKDDVT